MFTDRARCVAGEPARDTTLMKSMLTWQTHHEVIFKILLNTYSTCLFTRIVTCNQFFIFIKN